MKKHALLFCLTFIFALLFTFAGNAKADEVLDGWVNRFDDYWVYYEDGVPAEGWRDLDGYTYYFFNSGVPARGEWEIGGYYYRFNEQRTEERPWGGEMITGWYENDPFLQYYFEDGKRAEACWLEIDGVRYYFTENGIMAAQGMCWIGDECYWFDENGQICTGWQQDIWNSNYWYYFLEDGKKISTGWQKIDGKWYYFLPDRYYRAFSNEYEIGGKQYRFDKNGVMITGWFKDGDNWVFYKSSGERAYGWVQTGGKWYYFDAYEGMLHGLEKYIGDARYRFNDNGSMLTGWYAYVEGDYTYWYYYKSSGKRAHNEWVQVDGKWYYIFEYRASGHEEVNGAYYYFGDDGVMRFSTWIKIKPYYSEDIYYWYYFKSNGKRATSEFVKISGKWYYFDSGSYMVAGRKETIKGKLYSFAANGVLEYADSPGWKSVKDANGNVSSWFYVNSGGSIATKWQKINNKWYYFDPYYGSMYHYSSSPASIDGKLYLFEESGALRGENGGWIKGYKWNYWFYANKGGSLMTRWQKINNKWYYFDGNDGHMYAGRSYQIDGKSYTFDENGVWVP